MIKTAYEYHESTSYDRDNMSGHYLDWKNQPMVFKDYTGALPVILPAEVNFPDIGLFDLIKTVKQEETKEAIGLKDLSSIFRLSYSLTAKARQGSGDFYFRSAASAGALYPCEIYVAARSVNELEDGLYHFAIHRHCLYPLRLGDMTPYLTKSIQINTEKQPRLTFLLSAIYFRSAWKYRERSYRYHLLDTGHLLENLVLALNSLGLNPEIYYDFNDDGITHLLGLDNQKEVVLAAVSIYGQESFPLEDPNPPEKLPPSFSLASRVAAKETDYPIVREIHSAGATTPSSPETSPVIHAHLGLNVKEWIKNPTALNKPEVMNYAEAVYQRRSKRNFIPESLDRNQFDCLIDATSQPDLNSNLKRVYSNTFAIGILVNQVEGMDPGFYLLDPNNHSIGLVKPGLLSPQVARICLDQAWLKNAALYVLFLTNLKVLGLNWGPRGYRYAMMTAGRLGQRIYLLATAMDLGCCGIGAYYDREASALLELNQESRLLYLVALGPVKSKG